jgi:hypothetical protein
MPYFYALNDGQAYVIDDTTKSPVLVTKGRVTADGGANKTGTNGAIGYTASGSLPLVFTTGGLVTIWSSQDGRFDYRLARGESYFDYYVFAPATYSAAALFEVRGPSNELIFNSGWPLLRIQDVIAVGGALTGFRVGSPTIASAYPNSAITRSVGVANGGNKAYCMSDPGLYNQFITGSGGNDTRTVAYGAIRGTSGGFDVGATIFNESMNVPSGYAINSEISRAPQIVLSVDISNFRVG